MSGDDIMDELQFRVTVTRLGGQHTAREVMSDIIAMENARAEIVRLRAEVERLRAAGDALAAIVGDVVVPYDDESKARTMVAAYDAWREGRRER